MNLPNIKSLGDFFGGVTAKGGGVELFGFKVFVEAEAAEDIEEVDKVYEGGGVVANSVLFEPPFVAAAAAVV